MTYILVDKFKVSACTCANRSADFFISLSTEI